MALSGNWDRRVGRGVFLGLAGLSVAALALQGGRAEAAEAGYGVLRRDPRGVIDLPEGFQYRVISQEGTKLSNGAPVPSDHDGMAAFPGPRRGTTFLVRNHELSVNEAARANEAVVGSKNAYDDTQIGGTTGIVVDNDTRKALRDFVTSSGQSTNCAGGATPWGTWLTCEESREPNHGYVFEVDPRNPQNELSATPIREMGCFSHEAVGIDPETGIAYLTEDHPGGNANTGDPSADTGASFLYRFTPANRAKRPGALQDGGTLEVMTFDEVPTSGPDADLFNEGQRLTIRWAEVEPELAHEQAVATATAVRFNRLEGAFFRDGVFWFDDTLGGEERLGQIFRYFPKTNTLELFYEGTSASAIQSPDNITITPWGDLWFAEDEAVEGNSINRVVGVTPQGWTYTFARNATSGSEFAGPTFAPGGNTFFVNIQNPGLTLAIWGPFRYANRSRRAQMTTAAPPAGMSPLVSGELAEVAGRYGMSTLEAAAFDRLGVSLV
jgi:uncharacterized protein